MPPHAFYFAYGASNPIALPTSRRLNIRSAGALRGFLCVLKRTHTACAGVHIKLVLLLKVGYQIGFVDEYLSSFALSGAYRLHLFLCYELTNGVFR